MAGPNTEKLLFISWAENCSRSDNLARLFGGSSSMIYVSRLGSRFATVWIKYILQMWQTFRLLQRHRPGIVMVMVPPIFACVPVYLYCILYGGRYLTDTHTAAFTMSRWKPLLFLNAWFYRRALTNIVTNEHLAQQVIGDLPVKFEKVARFPLNNHVSIAVICSFNPDEPLDNIWQAARELRDVDFYATGKLKDAPARLIENKPANVTLTGFLSLEMYAGLLQGCHAVMVLTTRDHTMQRGAYEAMALGTPIITSNWEILRRTFSKGSLFVDNSPQSIVAAVRELQAQWPKYKQDIQSQRNERQAAWALKERRIRALIAGK